MMIFRIEIEQEEDGHWIAEVPELSGVLTYGTAADEARARVQSLALRVVAERLEHGEAGPELLTITFNDVTELQAANRMPQNRRTWRSS
jgi:predicted RNase H-like HicB family nuclease